VTRARRGDVKKGTKVVSQVIACAACEGRPEGMCSRCGGDGMDPDSPDCACDCCAGTGRCDACFSGAPLIQAHQTRDPKEG
jgi:hypothetical protein